jgi:rhodanese-related sulfurtransferase
MIKYLFSFFLIFGFLNAQQKIDFRTAFLYKGDVNSHEAYEMQQKGAFLVDVRTKREFNTSSAKDSINIPIFYEKNKKRVFNKQFILEIAQLTKNNQSKEVILICRSGSRTKLASNLLASYGFENIYNVKEGFQYDWQKTTLPVE